MPDLATFAKICKWLDRDPREFLGLEATSALPLPRKRLYISKKSKTVTMETATALGELILAAQRAIQAQKDLVGS